jgi:pimeloyl-ACP methyl ester carboxylesterase
MTRLPLGPAHFCRLKYREMSYSMKSRDIVITTGEGTFTASSSGSDEGPLVLALHGFPQSRHTWRDLLPALSGSGLHAVAPDQRGYSEGVRPLSVSAYRQDRLVADVLDIADSLEAPSFHLVGHDWGGQVAWLTAAYHPERVTSLSVLSRPHPAAFAAAMETDVEQLSRSGHHTRFAAPEATDELLADDFGNLRRGLEASGVSANDVSAYLETLAERPALDAALNWYRAVGPIGLGDPDCPIVGVPTLYVWGGRDSSVGRPAAELTSSFVSGPFTFIEIASSGHFVTDDGGGPETVEAIAAHILESAG